MSKRKILAISTLLTINSSALALAQSDFGIAETTTVTDGYQVPWGIEVISDTEYLFTERHGQLFHYLDDVVTEVSGLPETLYKPADNWGAGGLMDVSLHPQYATNGLVYIAYDSRDNGRLRFNVARFKLDGNKATNLEVIVTEEGIFSEGSRIAWQDGRHFFASVGIGGDPCPDPGADNLESVKGKILRFMADGSIPADNPFLDGAGNSTSIWSYGHRNVQGLYFEETSGRLYASEHGPWGGGEINRIEAGQDHGWPRFSYGLNYESTDCSSVVTPISEDEARATTVMPSFHWKAKARVGPSGLMKISNSNFTEWNCETCFLVGSMSYQPTPSDPQSTALLWVNLATGEYKPVLKDIGRLRDVAQLPSGDLLILVDQHSPNRGDSGRIIKLSRKDAS
jgi:glucose/arabinose dehydrogenase